MQSAETMVRPTEEASIIPQVEQNQAAIDLLRSWREEGDPDEQRETGQYLMRVLAEDNIVIGRVQDGDRT